MLKCGCALSCVPQRVVMCALAVSCVMILSMTHYCSYNAFQAVISHPYEHVIQSEKMPSNRCTYNKRSRVADINKHGEVYWPRSLKDGVIQSVWLGYIVSGMVGGLTADMFGPRHVWGFGLFLNSISALFLPWLAKVSPYAVLVCFILIGLGQGVINPCSSVLVAQWAPENERTIFVALIESGKLLGFILMFILHDLLTLWHNWEMWLYVCVILCMSWILMWYSLYYDSPVEHTHARTQASPSQLELQYTQTPMVSSLSRPQVKCKPVVPWKQILTSSPFLSLMSFCVAVSWFQSIIIYYLYNYLTQALDVVSVFKPTHVNVSRMSVCVAFVSCLCHGVVCDWLINSGYMSRTVNRRSFLIVSNYLIAVILLTVPLLDCKTLPVLLAFFLIIHAHGVSVGPMHANIVDIAPRYAGALRGVNSSLGALGAVICRNLATVLVRDPSDPGSWFEIFQVSVAIMVLFSTPYLFYGSGDIQPWNYFGTRIPRTELGQSSPTETPRTSKTLPAQEENT